MKSKKFSKPSQRDFFPQILLKHNRLKHFARNFRIAAQTCCDFVRKL